MTGSGERANDFGSAISKLVKYMKRWMPAIVVSMVIAAIGTVLQIVGPDMLKDMTNEISHGLPALVKGQPILGSIDMSAVVNIAWLLVFLYAGSFLLNMVQSQIMAVVTQRISQKMRSDISSKINRLPLRYYDSNSNGDVLSRVTNDVDAVSQTLNQSLGTLISAVTMFIGSLVMMFYNNWIMTLAAIASVIVGFGLMLLITSRSQKYFVAQQKDLGAINGHVDEVYSGHNVVKAYNASAQASRIFEGINEDLYSSAWKSQFLSGLMMPLMTFVGNLGYVVVCVVGAALAMNGTISFGVIVAFMMYIRLFTQPLSQFAQVFNNLQRTAAASERVFTFLAEPELGDESGKARQLSDVRGAVEFEHVNFSYVPGKPVIKDFSASVKAGQKVAIVGPTGAGKTTIVNLLMRFYDLNGGRILLDGIPTDSVPRSNVHEQFGMVLQDAWIFDGTIRENLAYSKKNVTDEQIEAACKAVGLDYFIRTLPQGYDTVLDDRTTLSEGQKQLLTIARAMIQDAPLLILDEATSSVDTRTEQLVQKAMDDLTVGRTSFVIAHRLSTIRDADLILVMKDGDIIESGTHEDLLTRNGFYADLYNSQFQTPA
ncbi:MAG: ABC transporter ATP-binding protein/permease [Bifidobacteriaceae bacterium]|jgi:ATP-binding cassette subfamily B protein|nr:ABC transporter ATP-binding protein/permease [Bifidobacteriaceae bacterium]MCI1915151.1 ABC transporter ATP-binding protein/permease [Bifidobacteriaceae bacterium]